MTIFPKYDKIIPLNKINFFIKEQIMFINRYESAKGIYKSLGIDTEAVLDKIQSLPVSLHCWQGDDVKGFDHD